MLSFITAGVGFIAATCVFLLLVLRLTQDPSEPPLLATTIPFVSPLIGMAKEKSRFHKRLRDDHKLPIYTLRLPFQRMYIVNSTRLIPLLQKQWRIVSFAAIAANAGRSVGMSKEATDIMHKDLASEHGFSVSWPRYILPAIGPGKGLDAMNRRAVEVLADEIKRLQAEGSTRVGLSQWSRATMVMATTEAVWGPQNPYRDPDVVEAWRIFEAGFLTFSMFPFAAILFPKLLKAREIIAAAFISYMHKGGRKFASSLVHMRYEHHHEKFGLQDEDVARGEIGNTFAVLSNTTPCALWLIYHIFSDEEVLTNVRSELESLVHKEQDEEGASVHRVNLAAIRTCPILLSTFQEMMRFRAVNPGPRVLLDDVYLDDQYLLKKGSMLMIPATVQHTDIDAWGEDATTFDYLRFTRKKRKGQKRPNRVAFRAFGGGHILCPGRHFASTELMAYAALLVLQFDIAPVGGKWVEPTCDNSPAQAGFPIPDKDIEIELRPRDPTTKWKVNFSGSGETMEIVSEDAAEGE